MSLGEMLKYMCLLSSELNQPQDSLTAMTAMGVSTPTRAKSYMHTPKVSSHSP